MIEKMKGTWYLGNKKFETRYEKIRELQDDEVLIKVKAAGICGTDVEIYKGGRGASDCTPPVILGHEYAGIVEKIGRRVDAVTLGDHVTVDPNVYCGKCHYCKIGKKQLCTGLKAYGVNMDGGFAQYSIVKQEQCYQLSKDIPLKYGAMAEPLACAIHGIEQAEIKLGDSVCIIGGGAIGLLMVQLAKISGASTVILSEPVEMRRKIGKQLGADYTINPMEEDIKERIMEILHVPGVDVVIECVGNVSAVNSAFDACKRGSTILIFSVHSDEQRYSLKLNDIFSKELKIVGSMINPDTHERAAQLLNKGCINVEPLITHSFPIENVEEAILTQMSNDSIKVVIESEEL